MKELRQSLLWLTRPLPVKMQNIICLGVFLCIRYVPVLSHEVELRSIAIRSRGFNRKKHPIKFFKLLSTGLLISSFTTALKSADALIARGLDVEKRISPYLPKIHTIFVSILMILTVCAGLYAINEFLVEPLLVNFQY